MRPLSRLSVLFPVEEIHDPLAVGILAHEVRNNDQQVLRGGLRNISVPVNSSNQMTVAMSGAPAVFNAGDSANTSVVFFPVAPRTTELNACTPLLFSPTSNGNRQIAVSVTP